ncbi:hypothetical protein BAE44_0003991, partial [Dichanthelium oligosanthes]
MAPSATPDRMSLTTVATRDIILDVEGYTATKLIADGHGYFSPTSSLLAAKSGPYATTPKEAASTYPSPSCSSTSSRMPAIGSRACYRIGTARRRRGGGACRMCFQAMVRRRAFGRT